LTEPDFEPVEPVEFPELPLDLPPPELLEEEPEFVCGPVQLFATPSQPDGTTSPRVPSNPAHGTGLPVWSS
jgi:hypothetical protein